MAYRVLYAIMKVEIGIANGDVDGESRNYAKAAVGALVPLLTSCMAKQVPFFVVWTLHSHRLEELMHVSFPLSQPEEYDEQVTPSMAASMCLALIAQVLT
jgi:hypothetical protein